MAMSMKGEVQLPAARATVWEKLNDPEVLKACIPGCQSVEKTGDTSFAIVAELTVGPVTRSFQGRIVVTDIDAPNRCRVAGEGDGSFANGTAEVSLAEAPDGGTILSYDVDASVGGEIAQLDNHLVDGFARKTADGFFANLAAAISNP